MPDTDVRLAELVAGLSVVSDLGKGLEDGQGLRTCLLAARLADELGLSDEHRATLYWVGLLRFVGCTATATEMASALGDELAVSAAFAALDPHDLRSVLRGAVASVGARPDRLLRFLATAPAVVREHETASCEVAQAIAARLGLPGAVGGALGQVFERWDGKGHPGKASGGQIPLPVRVWQIAHTADLVLSGSHGRADADAAVSAVSQLRRRAGSMLDPELVARATQGTSWLADPPPATTGAVLAAEPAPVVMVDNAGLDAVLGVFGLVADLKAPCFLGHSERVSALAEAAARWAGRPEAEVTAVRRAGLVHDVGRVAISSRLWSKRGPLTDIEREQVRLHPYYSERILARTPALASVAEIAAAHHERIDGSGYHRRLRGAAISFPAALLAAADAYVTAASDRPHRPAAAPDDRAAMLKAARDAGQLPGDAVDAVLAAAGKRPMRARRAAQLTERELDVLAAVASGLTNHAAARRLGISAKTVNTHLEHVYAKLGVSTRAAAIVRAMQNGWLDVTSQPFAK